MKTVEYYIQGQTDKTDPDKWETLHFVGNPYKNFDDVFNSYRLIIKDMESLEHGHSWKRLRIAKVEMIITALDIKEF